MYITPTVTGCSKLVAGASVVEFRLPAVGQSRALQHLEDFLFARAVEHRRGDMDSRQRLAREPEHVALGQLVDEVVALLVGIEFLELALHLGRRGVGFQILFEAASQFARGISEMSLEDLADVHARGHAQRIEHDIDRRSVGQIRHVFFGQNPRQHALVAMASRHLVAHLQAALHGDEHLDHLDDAGRKFVARLQALLLGAVVLLDRLDVGGHRLQRLGRRGLRRFVFDAQLTP